MSYQAGYFWDPRTAAVAGAGTWAAQGQAQWPVQPQQAYWGQAPGYYPPQQVGAGWGPGPINWREVVVGAALGALFTLLLGRALR